MDMKIEGPKLGSPGTNFTLEQSPNEPRGEMQEETADPKAGFDIGSDTAANEPKSEAVSGISSKTLLLSGLAAVALAAASFFPFAADEEDIVSKADNQARIEATNTLIAAGGISSNTLNKTDAVKAVSALTSVAGQTTSATAQVTPPQAQDLQGYADPQVKENLTQQIEDGQVRVVAFSLFDDKAQDGDVVQVSGYGFAYTVPLYHTPTWIQVPVPMNGPGQVTITGTYDGGGGITLGVGVPGAALPIRALYPGESLTLPVQ